MASRKHGPSNFDRVYKVQWPLSTNEQPMVLIYAEADGLCPRNWYYLPATSHVRKHLFRNRWVKVYFRGRIVNGKAVVVEFVRKGEWL